MRTSFIKPLALVVSITAHLGLSLLFGVQGSRAKTSLPSREVAHQTLQIYLQSASPHPAALNAPQPSSPPPPVNSVVTRSLRSIDRQPLVDTKDSPLDLTGVLSDPGYGDASWLSLVELPPSRYYLPNELTERPQVIDDIPLDNIRFLPDLGVRSVTARLLIDENGRVEDILLDELPLSSQAKAFISESFTSVKFEPGKLGALPVKSQLNIEVTLDYAAPKLIPVSVSQVR